ncbi:MAG: ABC transporter ATP-binding protein [Acidimicrobiales bacterium]
MQVGMPPHVEIRVRANGSGENGGPARGTLRRVLTFTNPYRFKIIGFLVVVMVGSLIALAPPLLFKQIIDVALVKGDKDLVTTLALLTLVAAAAEISIDLVQRYLSSSIGEGLIFDLRSAVFDHVQRMPLAFFTRTQTGALISRMNNDVIGAQRAVTGTLGQVVFNVFTLVSTIGVMVTLEWRMTALSLVLLPLFIIPSKRVGVRLQDLTREGMDLNASMNTTMTERFNVSGAMLVKLFGRHEDELVGFTNRAARVRDVGIKNAIYGRAFFSSLSLVGGVGTAVIYWWGGHLVIDNAIEPGTLVAMAALVTRIYQPITSLTNARIDVMTALVSFERVFEVLDAPRLIDDAPDAIELIEPKGAVEFSDVWFRYPSATEVSLASLEYEDPSTSLDDRVGPYVLEAISLHIQPGQLIALVGPSGAGKSTLASLVPRLYDVTKGSLKVDGHDVRALTQASLRQAIGVVNQDPHLFHDTVASNLRYARPDATDAELVQACRAAQIHQVIADLPDGYNTVVGERGYRLSGGEKQRLSIARMLLKNPAIVVLDEATSHLDAENEALVQQALSAALTGRTSIVIAHRLSTIQAADEIVVLEHGKIIERGSHENLLAAGKLYASHYQTLIGEDRGLIHEAPL